MNSVLLLVDIQNDYFPGGVMELHHSEEAGKRASNLLQAFRERGLPVVHVRHVSNRPGAAFFLPGTRGSEIHEMVRPLQGEQVFDKHFPNSFRETPLKGYLRGLARERLVIAGMMTHMCIDTTVRAASDLGFTCTLAGDACATRDLSFGGEPVPAEMVQVAFLAALNGSFAQVKTVKEICASLTSVNP